VGNVSSGNAENAASVANELSAYCLAAAPEPEPTPTPTPTPTPSNPQVQGDSTRVAALPATGVSSQLVLATVVAASAAAATLLGKLAFAVISRNQK